MSSLKHLRVFGRYALRGWILCGLMAALPGDAGAQQLPYLEQVDPTRLQVPLNDFIKEAGCSMAPLTHDVDNLDDAFNRVVIGCRLVRPLFRGVQANEFVSAYNQLVIAASQVFRPVVYDKYVGPPLAPSVIGTTDCTYASPCPPATAQSQVRAQIGVNPNANHSIGFVAKLGPYYLAAPASDQSGGEAGTCGSNVTCPLVFTQADTVGNGFIYTIGAAGDGTPVLSGGRDISPSTGQSWSVISFGGVTAWKTNIPEANAATHGHVYQKWGTMAVNGTKVLRPMMGVGKGRVGQPFQMTTDGQTTGTYAAGQFGAHVFTADQVFSIDSGDRSSVSANNVFGFTAGACSGVLTTPDTAALCSNWDNLTDVSVWISSSSGAQAHVPIVAVDNTANLVTINGHGLPGDTAAGQFFKGENFWRVNACKDLIPLAIENGGTGGYFYLSMAAAPICGLAAGDLVFIPRASDTAIGLAASKIIAPLMNHLLWVSNSIQANTWAGTTAVKDANVGNFAFGGLQLADTNSTIYSGFPNNMGTVGGFINGVGLQFAGSLPAFMLTSPSNVTIDRFDCENLAEGCIQAPGADHLTITNTIANNLGGTFLSANSSEFAKNFFFQGATTLPNITIADGTPAKSVTNVKFYNDAVTNCTQLLIGAPCVALGEGNNNEATKITTVNTGLFSIQFGGPVVTMYKASTSCCWNSALPTGYDVNSYGFYHGYSVHQYNNTLADPTGTAFPGSADAGDGGMRYSPMPFCGANQPTQPYSGPTGHAAGSPDGFLSEYVIYYGATTSKWPLNTASGPGATGSITFGANPTNGQTATINGQVITFVTSGATGAQVNIGASLPATLTNLVALISNSLSGFTPLVYLTPTSDSVSKLTIVSKILGADHNATGAFPIGLATNVAGSTIVAMAGGSNNAQLAGGSDVPAIYGDSNFSACITIQNSLIAAAVTNRIGQWTGSLWDIENSLFQATFTYGDGATPRTQAQTTPFNIVQGAIFGPSYQTNLPWGSFQGNTVILTGLGGNSILPQANIGGNGMGTNASNQVMTFNWNSNSFCNQQGVGTPSCTAYAHMSPVWTVNSTGTMDWVHNGTTRPPLSNLGNQDVASSFNGNAGAVPTWTGLAPPFGAFHCLTGFAGTCPDAPAPPGSRYPGLSINDAGYH